MVAPTTPFQPYADVHAKPNGPGDARPTALQVINDNNAAGKLKGKNILITGCTSGIGVETARALYETGASLFLAARDMSKLDNVINDITSNSEAVDSPRPVPIKIDLGSLASVRSGVEDLKSKTSKLNILINNAGILATPYGKTEDGFELQIGTNHFGHFLLFELVKPLLLEGAAEGTARVISLTSSEHQVGKIRFDDMHWDKAPETYDKWQAYAQSKIANVYFANAVTRYYGGQGITGLSVHPGGIGTDIARHLTQEDLMALGAHVDMSKIKNVEQGAATTVWAAVEPHFEDVANGGRFLADVGEAGPTVGAVEGHAANPEGYAPHAYDEANEDKLWKLSCEAVGITGN